MLSKQERIVKELEYINNEFYKNCNPIIDEINNMLDLENLINQLDDIYSSHLELISKSTVKTILQKYNMTISFSDLVTNTSTEFKTNFIQILKNVPKVKEIIILLKENGYEPYFVMGSAKGKSLISKILKTETIYKISF